MESKRKIAYMFMDLPYHVMITIASKLNLIKDTDNNLTHLEKIQTYFKRADSEDKLSDLALEMIPFYASPYYTR